MNHEDLFPNKMEDLQSPFVPDLIAFMEPNAKRLEFVERDTLAIHAEQSIDGNFTLLRDKDGDLIGFCLEGDPTKWAAFRQLTTPT